MRPSPLFSTIETGESVYDVEKATYKGIGFKMLGFMAVTIIVAFITALGFNQMMANNPTGLYVALSISGLVGFISVMIGRFNDRAAKYAGMIYCVCEGLFIGTLSATLELATGNQGISMIAVLSTLVIFAVMAVLFFTGIIRVGSFFRRFMTGLSFSLLAIILFGSIFQIFFPIQSIGALIGIEAFLLLYGVFTLMLNFDEAKMVVEVGASKDAEWSVALGMMVTLIYIYVEVLRVIALFVASNSD